MSEMTELVERLKKRQQSVWDGVTQGYYWEQDEMCAQAAAAIQRLELERDEAISRARSLSKALVQLTPGGSEYYTRHGEEYYADIKACHEVIRERFESGHRAKLDRVDERRRAEAAEKERDDALATIVLLQSQYRQQQEHDPATQTVYGTGADD